MNVDWIIFFAGVLNSLIGILVWKNNPKAKLNIFFGIFCLTVSVQIFFDFIFRFFPTLFILRSSYALATLIPPTASLWIFEICKFNIKKKWFKFLFFLPGLAFFIITFINGLIVKEIKGLSMLGYQGVLGPLFSAYTFYFVIYVSFFTILLYHNQRVSEKASDFLRRTQLNYILCGVLLYSGFATVFSLVLPKFFNIYDFTLLDAPSFIFFVGFTGYAITKHHLFDIRVIATELLTFAVWLILLIRTLLSATTQDFVLNGVILVFTVFFGILLIRSVLKEIEQKEEIKKMAKEVERAYVVEKHAKEQTEKAYEVEKKANEDLKKLDEYKNSFIRQTQHDLRTPLTIMMGYSDMLLGGYYGKLSKKAVDIVKRMQSVTQEKLKDVNNFLDLEQFKLGKGVVALKPGVELMPILEEVTSVLLPKAEAKGIYFKLEKSDKQFAVPADREKIKAAIFNVIDNAIKYTVKGGVTVSINLNDQIPKRNAVPSGLNLEQTVIIKVQDTGIGIPQDKIKNLFEEQFERTKQAEKIAPGSGVGLYLSNQIIKLHKGNVWAESEGEDKGSTFYIELPVG